MVRRLSPVLLCLLLILPPRFPAGADEERGPGYTAVTGPCELSLPRDHAPHPGHRTEWWYYTGNVQTDAGRRFGYQLTFFRRRISPPGREADAPFPASAWRTQQIYMAHAAVSDLDGGRHLSAERMSRAVLDLAGAAESGGTVRIHLGPWSAEIAARRHTLRARADGFAMDLILTPVKPPVFHGDQGYSRKGSTPERASCYYSYTRLSTAGTLTLGNRSVAVTGSSWMDHEFSSSLLEPGIVGWDWFSLQLDNGTELMLFVLRQKAGTRHPASGGTLVDAGGAPHRLSLADVTVSAGQTWRSPRSGAEYPVRWRLTSQRLGLDLTVTANLPDQEMQTRESTGVTYWEGSVSVAGTAGDGPVSGAGYVELTGYAGPFEAPL